MRTGTMASVRRHARPVLAIALATAAAGTVLAQQAPSPFGIDILRGAIADDPSKQLRGVTPRGPEQPTDGPTGQVTLVALVTEDGQPIDRGVIWRVFAPKGQDGKPRLVGTYRDAFAVVALPPGEYLVNAAFGRANATRKIAVAAGAQSREQFMLNVGLLRITALLGNNQVAPAGSTVFDVYSDERDQFGQRTKAISLGRPGKMFRLNSGLYQIVSLYGDANAVVQADLTVEPGKLTEATIIHHAARVTFRLVTRAGGEAMADTQWSVINREGDVVKESAGALPSHLFLPGSYTVNARSQGQVYRRQFAVKSGETAQIEVMMK